ncbi:uncharacterized protein LOC111630666 [Centruroides sculpturatus]|uniref:uncharacterized protein LOC111630666 n=1 Tax=Centruroides sculpturatus TaxID=218467 RepID=UPI000C6E4708|nr:uncharacterized protein LOC111630666 [Centruroides sculpturatus]
MLSFIYFCFRITERNMGNGKKKRGTKSTGKRENPIVVGSVSTSNRKTEERSCVNIVENGGIDQLNDIVTFVLLNENESKEVRVVKSLLTNSSEVLNEKLDETKTIEIVAISKKDFQVFISHAEGKRIKILNTKQALALMALSIKFEYPDLYDKSTNFILNNINLDNVWQIYKSAIEMENEKLIQETIYFILKNADDALKGNRIRGVPSSTLKFILSQDIMNIENEVMLFNALVYWAETEIKDKEDVTPADVYSKILPFLDKIRFLSMTIKEFQEGPEKSPIFTNEQKARLLQRITDEKSRSPLPFGSPRRDKRSRFPENESDIYINEITFVNYCQNYEIHRIPFSRVQSVFKSKDKPFFLTSVILMGCRLKGNFILKLEDDIKFKSSADALGIIEFSPPIFIRRNKQFEFVFEGEDFNSFYSCENIVYFENTPFYVVSSDGNNGNNLSMHCLFWSVMYFVP